MRDSRTPEGCPSTVSKAVAISRSAIDTHTETDTPAEPEDLGEGGQPKIYYTDGFTTDYSYVFTHNLVPGRKQKAAAARSSNGTG